ncbi:glycosyltransferase family 4 protein, partial [Enterococcus faecalis]|nr:glycosyltransferase family 4 protein [Enterococcus faecalis]
IPKKMKKGNVINIVRHSMIYPNKIDINILNNTAEILKSLQKKHNKKIVFTVCGDGNEYRDELKNYCEEIFPDLIKFQPGKKIFDTLSMGDIYLYNTPSNSLEGFSNAISEAQAMGLPIVADNKGGNIEQILYGGFLCTNWKDVRSELDKLVESQNLREKYGEISREKIRSRGGLEVLSKKYHEIFLESWNN